MCILNSNLIAWFMGCAGLNSGMGITRWIAFTVEAIPIPKIIDDGQRSYIDLVNNILASKVADVFADTSALEAKIDRMVYQLYGLTDAEIRTIESI